MPLGETLRILRIADIEENPRSGMGGYLAQTTDELRRRGHDVQHLWSGDLAPGVSGPARRMASPVAVVKQVRGASSPPDVVEIHEPLGAAYGIVHRALGLPPMVALSYGLEVRSWTALCERARIRGQSVSLRSRCSVPATILSQARIVYRTAEALAVPSSLDREWLIAHGRAPDRVVFAPTGVEDGIFAEPPDVHADDAFIVLVIGSWIDRKGAPEIAAAWPTILEAIPDARLVIAGAGVPSSTVMRDFADRGCNIEVLERLTAEEVRDQLRSADIFLLPSWFEGLPLSALEAAAAGLPCVLSSVCGNLDFARPAAPEEDGALLVPPHDAAAVARAVIRLAKDDRLREELASNARARARQFTWRRTTDALEQAYAAAASA